MRRVVAAILCFILIFGTVVAFSEAEKWKCPKCGNSASGKFCSKCGTKKPANAETVTPTPDPTKTPEPTATPEPTQTPEPTATPEPTKTPEPTEIPIPTETPEVTETQEPVPKAEEKEDLETKDSVLIPETEFNVKLPHFLVQLNGKWLKTEGEKKVSFYGKEIGSFENGFFRVVEVSEDHSSTQNDTRRKMYYDVNVEAIVEAVDIDGQSNIEEIQIDDTLAELFDTDQKQDDGSVARIYYALSFVHAGNGILAMYSNTSVANEEAKNQFIELLKSISFRFEKVSQRAFENDIIHLTGYEVDPAKKTLTVEFWWHNGQREANAFITAFSIEAYQNKIQLNPGSTYGIEDNQWTKIQYGGDIVCYEVFQLRDATTPVTLVVDKIFDFTNKYKDSEYKLELNR